MRKDFGGWQEHNQPHRFAQKVMFSGAVQSAKAIQGPGNIVSPIWQQAPQFGLCDPGYASLFFDDFYFYETAKHWTTFGDTGVVTAVADNTGVITIAPTADTDTHAGGIATTVKHFLPTATRKIYFEAKVKFTEAATNEASVFVGMTAGTVASDVPLIDNAGTPTTDDRICFYKQTGTTTAWQCGTSVGATQDDGTTGVTRVSGSWHKLGFIATSARVDFYVDDKWVRVVTDTADLPDTAMAICLSIKQGSAAKETLYVDYVKCVTIR